MLRRQLPAALGSVIVFTVLLGLVYPLLITGVSQVALETQADGSLIERNGEVVGSELIGQEFEGEGWFMPRPSAVDYDGSNSGASNLGPSSPRLLEQIDRRVRAYRKREDLPPTARVPVDAVTASASGLDPGISVANARLQAPRVARERGLPLSQVQALIDENTHGRALGFLGEETVNVFLLNLALADSG